MAVLIEEFIPVVKYQGLNTAKDVTMSGTVTMSGAVSATSTLATTGAVTPTGGIAAAGGFTASARNFHTGGTSAQLAADGNNSTPATTETYITEVFVPCNVTLTGIAVFNGSDVTGNMKVGLANSSGAVVASAASVAGSGTDAYQLIPFTATYAAKGPATYYTLVQYDSTTARYNTFAVGAFGASKKTAETFGTLTTVTPPTTFTTALGNIATLY